jgi:hypothetical protein
LEENTTGTKMKIALFPSHGSLNSKPVFGALIDHLKEKNENIMIDRCDDSCDVAVIWSVLWRGRMEQNKKIWEFFRRQNKPVVVLEVGGIKRNVTWKMGINGINRDADFANQEIIEDRWPKFKIEMKPWKQTGNVIVICGQHDNSEQWLGKPKMPKWTVQQIQELRKFTDKPILVRPHPRNQFTINEKEFKDVKIKVPNRDYNTYDDTDFKKTLQSTWAVINHSSNPAMEAVFSGIPVFVSQSSLCYDVGNHSLGDIKTPSMPNRAKWANWLSYTEWTVQEIREGLPWVRIRNRLLERYIK